MSHKPSMEELRTKVNTLSIDELSELFYQVDGDNFDERPPSIEEFIYGDKYLGKTIGMMIYPFWVEYLKKIYPSPFVSPYYEVDVLAARGLGKTAIALVSVAYDACRLLCLSSPQLYYKLVPGTLISFALFSASLSHAEDVDWNAFINYITNSEFFRSKLVTPEKDLLKRGRMLFQKNIQVETGSRSGHAIGKAFFGGIIDEANFQGEKSQQARENYSAIIGGMTTRFMQGRGKQILPGTLWVVSSPNFKTDFLEERLNKQKDTPGTLVIQNMPVWQAQKDKVKYSGEKFQVFLGLQNRDPFIISDKHDPKDLLEIYHKIIDVPIEYYPHFDKDLINAVRDLAGYSITASTELFRYKDPIYRCQTVPNRFTTEVFYFDFNAQEDITDFLVSKTYFKSPMHPECYRFFHVDVGLTNDRLGIAAVFAVPEKRVQLLGDESTTFYDRTYYVDFAFAVKAKEGQEVPLHKVKDFVIYLKQLGYPIRLVTTDQFEGRMYKQSLRLGGINTGYTSVDKDRHPYRFLADLINQGRCVLPNNTLLGSELAALKDDGKKVDHPRNGSKDVCLSGETLVPLLDGRQIKLMDLPKGEEVWVYSVDEFGHIVPAQAISTGLTKRDKVVKILLDNGRSVVCTGDHLVMMRDGSYRSASLLKSGDSLMPLYLSKTSKGYLKVYDPRLNKFISVHRLVNEYLEGPLQKGYQVHHVDGTKINNHPNNLKAMSASVHWALHHRAYLVDPLSALSRREKSLEEYNKKEETKLAQRERIRKLNVRMKNGEVTRSVDTQTNCLIEYNRSDSGKIKQSKCVQKMYQEGRVNCKGLLESNQAKARKDVTVEKVLQMRSLGYSNVDIADELRCRVSLVERRVNEAKKNGLRVSSIVGRTSKKYRNQRQDKKDKAIEMRNQGSPVIEIAKILGCSKSLIYQWVGKNHTVKKVILLEELQDVYCLRVGSTGNFAITAGVIVHNSDAVAGAVWNCLNSDQISDSMGHFTEYQGYMESLFKRGMIDRKRATVTQNLGVRKY